MSKEKIVDRIRKLLRVADPTRGASQQEQETATAAAQKLLLEHHLHLDSIGDLDDAADNDTEIGQDTYSMQDETAKNLGWKKHALWQICKPLLVRACYSSYAKQMNLVGTKSACEIVKYLHGYVTHSIEYLANQYVRDLRRKCKKNGEGWSAGISRQARYSFCMAAAGAVGVRLSAQYRKVASTNASSTALAVQSENALEAKYKELFPNLRTTRVRAGSDYRSREAGAMAGKNLSLHTGMSQGSGGQRQIS